MEWMVEFHEQDKNVLFSQLVTAYAVDFGVVEVYHVASWLV